MIALAILFLVASTTVGAWLCAAFFGASYVIVAQPSIERGIRSFDAAGGLDHHVSEFKTAFAAAKADVLNKGK